MFYFTGTGNSLKVTKDIAAGVEGAKLMSMASNIKKASDLAPQGAIGFVFPVYYCGLPQLVRAFISTVDLNRASYLYLVCTYGATGGNAGCISQTKKLLREKGKRLSAAFYVKTVDNFILWTWDIPSTKKHSALHEKAKRKSDYIANIVSAREDYFDKSVTEHTGPLLFGYKHFCETVNTGDKAFYCLDNCKACGLCEELCPTDNICLSEGSPIWKSETCQRCLACLHLCPTTCIQYGKRTVKRQRYRNPYITIEELKRSNQ